MKDWILNLIRCPSCQVRPDCRESSTPVLDPSGSELTFSCGHRFPVVRGIPRFVGSDQYARSFSFEWGIHRRTQFDSNTGGASTRRFTDVSGVHPHELKGRLALDAGVGAGRFAEVLARAGARVVGVDLSLAIDVARENLAALEGVGLLQADLLSLPLRPDSFDFIYSIGVLHHTPDAERAFRSLVQLLKPGGSIAVYVYPRYGISWRISDLYRRVTTRLPHRLLYLLSHAAIPLYYLNRVPIVGGLFTVLFPVSNHPNRRWRVLDTFDWYSPHYQSKHTYPEVFRWFRSAGLTDIELMDPAVCLRGRKPPTVRVSG